MQTFRRIAAVLTFPAIAWLGAACERTDTPTGAALPPAALQLSSGDDRWVNLVGVPNPPGSSCIDPGYNSIGAAVAASTSGDIIHVCAGMYNENVVINNVSLTSLTLLGAQAGTPVATRAFGGPLESTVKGSMLMVDAPVFQIAVPNVTIDGFSVTNTVASGSAIGIGVKVTGSGALVKNNIVDGVFTPDLISSSSSQAIYLQNGPDNVTILGNEMSKVQSIRSAKGIFIGDASSTDPSTNILIQDNSISDVTSDNRGAYGILINNGANLNGATANTGLVIRNNTIANLVGSSLLGNGWVHAIGLETNTPSVVVRDNSITALVSPSPNKVAVFFEDNPSYSTGLVNQNNFNVTTLAFGIAVAPTISGTAAVDGTCNWWGDPNGPGPVGPGAGAMVSPRVAFTPWLLAPGGACRGGSPSGGTVTGGGQIDVMSGVTSGVGSFGFSAKQATHSGHLDYLNHVSNTHLNCTVDIVVILSPNAHLEGMCSSNSYTGRFQADVQDNGNPGKRADKFTITYNNGTTTDGAMEPIRSGNIEIH